MTALNLKPLRDYLNKDLKNRVEQNPTFSLRAYARLIEISPSALSQILRAKRNVSLSMAEYILKKLGVASPDLDELIQSVKKGGSGKRYRILDETISEEFANGIYFAILALSETEDFDARPEVIASRLGVSTLEVSDAIRKLDKHGMIRFTENGFVSNDFELPLQKGSLNEAWKESYSHKLEKAKQALHAPTTENHSFLDLTLAVDVGRIPEARELTRQYLRSMGDLLERTSKVEVFQLSVQFFPISQ